MSSFRRSHHASSTLSDFDTRFENRNSEDVHTAVLAASYAEHLRINECARLAVEVEEARLYRLKLQEQASQEEERVRLLEERTREEIRLREIENRARQIPKVPARVSTPPPAPAQESKPAAPISTQSPPAVCQPIAQQQHATQTATTQPSNILQTTQAPTTQAFNVFSTQEPAANQCVNPFAPATLKAPNPTAQEPTPSSNPFAQQPSQAANPFAQPTLQPANASLQQQIQQLNTSATTSPAQTQTAPKPRITSPPQQSIAVRNHAFLLEGVTKYVEIHQNLKRLRQFVKNGCEVDKKLKNQVGDLRRTLRMAIGQIMKDKSQNKEPVSTYPSSSAYNSNNQTRPPRSSILSSQHSLLHLTASTLACSCCPSPNRAKELYTTAMRCQ
jgi:nucleoporin GLE1